MDFLLFGPLLCKAQMIVDARLSIVDHMVDWKEYDKEGNVTDSDRNVFTSIYNWVEDIDIFYKFDRQTKGFSFNLD